MNETHSTPLQSYGYLVCHHLLLLRAHIKAMLLVGILSIHRRGIGYCLPSPQEAHDRYYTCYDDFPRPTIEIYYYVTMAAYSLAALAILHSLITNSCKHPELIGSFNFRRVAHGLLCVSLIFQFLARIDVYKGLDSFDPGTDILSGLVRGVLYRGAQVLVMCCYMLVILVWRDIVVNTINFTVSELDGSSSKRLTVIVLTSVVMLMSFILPLIVLGVNENYSDVMFEVANLVLCVAGVMLLFPAMWYLRVLQSMASKARGSTANLLSLITVMQISIGLGWSLAAVTVINGFIKACNAWTPMASLLLTCIDTVIEFLVTLVLYYCVNPQFQMYVESVQLYCHRIRRIGPDVDMALTSRLPSRSYLPSSVYLTTGGNVGRSRSPNGGDAVASRDNPLSNQQNSPRSHIQSLVCVPLSTIAEGSAAAEGGGVGREEGSSTRGVVAVVAVKKVEGVSRPWVSKIAPEEYL